MQIENPLQGLPPKPIKRVMVGAEIRRHGPVASNGLIEHSAESLEFRDYDAAWYLDLRTGIGQAFTAIRRRPP